MANQIRAMLTNEEIALADTLAIHYAHRGVRESDARAAADLVVRWSQPTVERIRTELALREAHERTVAAAVAAGLDRWEEVTRAETPAARRGR